MKRRFSLFALLLALLLALSACSGQPSPQPQQPLTTLQELQELLTRDYIVGYLWYCDGLPEQGELTEDEYLPVDPAGGYATLADLQQLVEKTYTPACVSALLQMRIPSAARVLWSGRAACIKAAGRFLAAITGITMPKV